MGDATAVVGTLAHLCLAPRSPGPIGVFLEGGPVVEMWLAEGAIAGRSC